MLSKVGSDLLRRVITSTQQALFCHKKKKEKKKKKTKKKGEKLYAPDGPLVIQVKHVVSIHKLSGRIWSLTPTSAPWDKLTREITYANPFNRHQPTHCDEG